MTALGIVGDDEPGDFLRRVLCEESIAYAPITGCGEIERLDAPLSLYVYAPPVVSL